jgi:hypothetical protein
MSKFKIYSVVISLALVLFSCTPEDTKTVPLRDYGAQYEEDNAMIEDYLKTYYIEEIVNHPGYQDDQDIKLTKIPLGNTTLTPIWDSPLLKSKNYELHGITYKIYYIESRIGDLTNGEAPSRVDEVLSSYDGTYLKYNSTTENNITVTTLDAVPFESVEYPEQWLGLDNTIKGWTEIFPLFNTGTYNDGANPNDPAIYNDFGAGVMFLPSGLGYYGIGSFQIPAYSPLVFVFKLYDVKHIDHDSDGVLSNDEDVNHDGLFIDDTDNDGTYDIYDIDDDGDGELTKNEIKNAAGVVYSFDAIPDCSGNTTDPLRIKRHLDKNCYKD